MIYVFLTTKKATKVINDKTKTIILTTKLTIKSFSKLKKYTRINLSNYMQNNRLIICNKFYFNKEFCLIIFFTTYLSCSHLIIKELLIFETIIDFYIV